MEPTGRAQSRDQVRERIRLACREVAGRRDGRVLVVEGAAGMGKSRVLDDARHGAAADGFEVVHARVGELDRVVPLSALRTACGQLEPERPPPGAVSGIADRLATAARGAPLLVALDDVDRCDALTARALGTLVRALAELPVLWLLARRHAGPHPQSVLAEPHAQVHRLGPLEPGEVRSVCTEVLGARPGEALVAAAGRHGVPALLVDRIRDLRRDGRIRAAGDRMHLDVAPDAADRGPDAAPEALARWVWDGFTMPARRLLQAGAVLGRPFTLAEVSAMLHVTAADLEPAVREAMAGELLVRHGTRLDFRSAPVRDALAGQLTPVLRSLLHREAAAGLQALGGCEIEQVEHLMRGGRAPGTEPGGQLDRVLDACAGTAPARATRLLLRALDLVGPDAGDRPRLMVRAVRSLVDDGELVRARELATLASNLPPDLGSDLALALAEGARLEGRTADAARWIDRGLDAAGGRFRDRLLALRVHVELERGDVEAARRAAEPLPADAAGAVRARAALAAADGDLGHALDLFRAAPAAPGPDLPGWWYEVPLLLALDRCDDARALLARARRTVPGWALAAWTLRVAELRLARGRTAHATRAASAGLRLHAATGPVTAGLHAVLAELAALTGRPDEARAHLTRAGHLCGGDPSGVPRVAWAHAVVDPKPAADRIRRPDRLRMMAAEPRAAAELVRAELAAGRTGAARELAQDARSLALRAPGSTALAAGAAHATGLAHADGEQLRAAARGYRDCGRPLARALALADAADRDAAAGHVDDAVRHLRESARAYRACGLDDAAARAERDARRTRRAPERAAPSGWDDLTDSEIRVVRLVAQGMTNRGAAAELHLSRHTVDSHLRHSFAKLGVSNRVALSRLALQQDPGAVPA